jgi:hypothetical protein
MPTKKMKCFAFYFLKVHLHYFSKIKSHKTVGIKGFLTIFANPDLVPDPAYHFDENPDFYLMRIHNTAEHYAVSFLFSGTRGGGELPAPAGRLSQGRGPEAGV